eukprot:scaffold41496_cov26-Tisochrysis_lutea.AAC.3
MPAMQTAVARGSANTAADVAAAAASLGLQKFEGRRISILGARLREGQVQAHVSRLTVQNRCRKNDFDVRYHCICMLKEA